jgi:hypothetical protein
MADMLVKLYTLPDVAPLLAELKQQGIEIRQAHPPDKNTITEWVRQKFGAAWAVGCEVACLHEPVLCYIAVQKASAPASQSSPYDLPAETLVGFACYDVAAKSMIGPEGVREDCRGRGIGTALLLTTLHAMAAQRYAYAVIGWAGPVEFYTKTVGATLIEDSEPGIFRGPLQG